MSQKVTTGVRPTLRIADKNQIPATEPERQYYFMALLKQQLVPERAKTKTGKEYLTACITTSAAR